MHSIATSPKRTRIDWSSLKDQLDLAQVTTALLGPANGRQGERGRRLWWHCPFHEDKNPSFCVTPGKSEWCCFGCGAHGDAPELVMRLKGVKFPEAIAILAKRDTAVIWSRSGQESPPYRSDRFLTSDLTAGKPVKDPGVVQEHSSSGLPLADALALVDAAAERLWMPEGSAALAYLHGRGLTDETIKAARLGWTPNASLPVGDGTKYWRVSGITLP